MKCYWLEDHTTRECPKNNNFKICSECNVEGHLWHQCTEQTKTCINCGKNHSTLAMKCSKTKAILKRKRKEEIKRGKITYSEAARTMDYQQVTQTQIPPRPTLNITREDSLKINICIVHSHYRNIENPDIYSQEPYKILTANNLPNIIIPDEPKSSKIFISTPQEVNTNMTNPEIIPVKAEAERSLQDEEKDCKSWCPSTRN